MVSNELYFVDSNPELNFFGLIHASHDLCVRVVNGLSYRPGQMFTAAVIRVNSS